MFVFQLCFKKSITENKNFKWSEENTQRGLEWVWKKLGLESKAETRYFLDIYKYLLTCTLFT